MSKVLLVLLLCILLSGCNKQEKSREKSAEEILFDMGNNTVNH